MPYAFDQPDNAARLVRLGTSRTIARKKYIANRVAGELVQLLTEPRYHERAAEIARQLQNENGACAAADAIERYLQESSIPRAFA